MANRCGESAMLANTMKSNFDGPPAAAPSIAEPSIAARMRAFGAPAGAARQPAKTRADDASHSRVSKDMVVSL
jgi:hypothetical protein